MPYTPPTAADIKARFPEFVAVADGVIDGLVTESALYIDATWIEADRPTAVKFWVAHQLVREGFGTSAAAQLAKIGDFQRIKSGDLEVSRGSSSGGAGSSGDDAQQFSSTQYGARYLELRNRSHPGALIV